MLSVCLWLDLFGISFDVVIGGSKEASLLLSAAKVKPDDLISTG
jgi:hypothetical protein